MHPKFLVIQTSFLGDVILATAVLEKLNSFFPHSEIDILVRKGNEAIFYNHPFLHEVIVWNKKEDKLKNLLQVARKVRGNRYKYVINLHRHGSSGFIAFSSGAPFISGFHTNPFAVIYTHKYRHEIGNNTHETARNQQLIAFLTDTTPSRPKLYPSAHDIEQALYGRKKPYVCMAPGSVWFTKRLPVSKWVELIKNIKTQVYLIGAPDEFALAEEIRVQVPEASIENLCGKLTLLQTAALMQHASMNYVNDSAPLHLCSATNAPCTAFFCSTLPEFGFGPLSDTSRIIQTHETLSCRPCGIHGKTACPEGHFRCATSIELPHE